MYKVWVKAVLFFSVNGKTPFACFPVISPFYHNIVVEANVQKLTEAESAEVGLSEEAV